MKALSTTVNGSAISVSLYAANVTPNIPARQVTVGQFPSNNPNWSRQIQVSDEYVFVKRGSNAVAISLADMINLALTQEPNLTWTPPVILTQPANTSVVHGGGNVATINTTAGSEYTMTYLWKYSTDSGGNWANASGTVSNCTFAGFNTATLNCTPTQNTLNGAYFKCIVTDNASPNGSVNTSTVTLTIL